jgi:RimJ/RimL family protein N-acetyltransferase
VGSPNPAARPTPDVELQPVSEADEWLTVALETDPEVMAELGGAWTAEQARATHARRLRTARETGSWWFKLVRRGDGAAVGSIVLWDSEWEGAPVSEAGWMVLPAEQGKGYASAGVRLLLERAAAAGDRWGDIHASPGATNGASNAICRKANFELVGDGEVDYGGRMLHVNHWVHRAER